MGCDIHQYAEVLVNGEWIAEQAASYTAEEEDEGDEVPRVYLSMNDSGDRSRNYFLFGLLSEGVRYHCPWAFLQKGAPEVMSPQVAAILKQWEGDAHSENYLDFKELGEKLAELLIRPEPEAKEYLECLTEWVNSMGPTTGAPEDRRVVFWFDN